MGWGDPITVSPWSPFSPKSGGKTHYSGGEVTQSPTVYPSSIWNVMGKVRVIISGSSLFLSLGLEGEMGMGCHCFSEKGRIRNRTGTSDWPFNPFRVRPLFFNHGGSGFFVTEYDFVSKFNLGMITLSFKYCGPNVDCQWVIWLLVLLEVDLLLSISSIWSRLHCVHNLNRI